MASLIYQSILHYAARQGSVLCAASGWVGRRAVSDCNRLHDIMLTLIAYSWTKAQITGCMGL